MNQQIAQANQKQFVDRKGEPLSELHIIQVSNNWFIGRTFGGTFCGYSLEEVKAKYASFALNRRQHQIAAAAYQDVSGNIPTFLERHGYAAGMRVRLHPVVGGRHDGNLYVIRLVGYQVDGSPAVWLSGRAGSVPLQSISRYTPAFPFSHDNNTEHESA